MFELGLILDFDRIRQNALTDFAGRYVVVN